MILPALNAVTPVLFYQVTEILRWNAPNVIGPNRVRQYRRVTDQLPSQRTVCNYALSGFQAQGHGTLRLAG